ncbi:MAG: hypothetical protein KBF88_03140 [Polyangiaceae bacterium]|nr:hypothetical protein [Polyangiaceae bacterium]
MELTWKGAEANDGSFRLVRFDGECVELLSQKPFPPGARPEGIWENGDALRLKVHACTRSADRFSIRARVLDLTRTMRERLQLLSSE